MNYKKIKAHLKPATIKSRISTLDSQITRAIAPRDLFDDEKVRAAVVALGQNPEQALTCVYCSEPAAGWDHLLSIGKRGSHSIRNLVPCCEKCNSARSGCTWQAHVRRVEPDAEKRAALEERLTAYSTGYTEPWDRTNLKKKFPEQMARLAKIRDELVALLMEADDLAKQIALGVR